jgi:hypothetical protein
MVIPEEFFHLGQCFIQDDYEWGIKHLTEWIKQALELTHLPPSGVQRLKDFLDQLLSQKDDKLLEDTWARTGTSIGRYGGSLMRDLLTEIRQLLDEVRIKGPPGVL